MFLTSSHRSGKLFSAQTTASAGYHAQPVEPSPHFHFRHEAIATRSKHTMPFTGPETCPTFRKVRLSTLLTQQGCRTFLPDSDFKKRNLTLHTPFEPLRASCTAQHNALACSLPYLMGPLPLQFHTNGPFSFLSIFFSLSHSLFFPPPTMLSRTLCSHPMISV
jgi:hypothetical protein